MKYLVFNNHQVSNYMVSNYMVSNFLIINLTSYNFIDTSKRIYRVIKLIGGINQVECEVKL
jgi:hypothetical protein